ncbi:MAG: UDP-N-acetylglucosamine 1-carboxyvinyltransferase [Pirellulaceae bacterium]
MPTSTFNIRKSTLSGSVSISGAKNSVLKLLAASILTRDPVTIRNYPTGMLDVEIHREMLEVLGKRCQVAGDCLTIEEGTAPSSELSWNKRSIRNTLLILGALTARTGAGRVPLPGGCPLGDRKHDLHVMLLEALGARVVERDGWLEAEAPNGLQGADIKLPIRSTGATENAILCGTLARGVTRIWNPHVRPEILDLIAMLRSMGSMIHIFGQEHIEVVGADELGGAKHYAMPDNMEAITWLIGAVITDGDIEILNFPWEHLEVPLIFLQASGAKFFRNDNTILVRGGTCYPIEISTGPYPGINSDMQPLFAAFAACARGESRITDLRFVERFGYAQEFRKLGIETTIADNILRISGGASINGAEVTALDLRAGAALVLLGMVAHGETRLCNAWQVERGYNNFIGKLQSLGGAVTVEENGE